MLQQLEALKFENDMYQALSPGEKFGEEIKKLLESLNKQRLSTSLIQHLFDFEVLFNMVGRDVKVKKKVDSQAQLNETTMGVE